MSLLTTALSKAEEAKQAGRLQAEASYDELVKLIIDETLSDEPSKATKSETDKVVVLLTSCTKSGVADESEVRALAEAASLLKMHLLNGEAKEIDTASLESEFREIADRCRREVESAQRSIHEGRRVNLERINSRQQAQRILRDHPELGPMVDRMELSWSPKVSQG